MEEFALRERAKKGTSALTAKILSELFDKQQDFSKDTSRNKVVLGSRRAGKTEMWTRIAVVTALEKPRGLIRIWSSSRLRAKELLWANFRYLFERHGIKPNINDTELSITFSNGSIIRVVGADKDQTAQRKRGDKTVLEIVLETQSFGPFVRQLVEDVIEPSLLDNKGTICLEGTPGPLCAGFWFEVSGGEETANQWTSKDGWSVHRWTMLDNPHIPHAREELIRKKLQRRWADDNPTYLREWCGRWVNDLESLYYKFDLLRNTYDTSQVQPWGPGWTHVLGWDLGSRDDMAIVIWGWHPSHSGLYEVYSWKKPGALAAEVMEQMDRQEREKGLQLIEQVADTGGGGRMYVEEVMSRYNRKFTAAKKTQKYEHVRLFNDDLLVGNIKVISGSPLQVELSSVMRDPDWPDPDKPDEPPRESPSSPNHCSDSALYSYRAAWHYIKPLEEKRAPHISTPEWMKAFLEKQKRGANTKFFDPESIDYGYGTD